MSVTTGSHAYKRDEDGRLILDQKSPQEYITGGACIVCGEPFEGWHLRSKRTCSDACRKSLSRYEARLQGNFHRAMEIIDFLGDCLSIDDYSQTARSALITLRECIDELLDEQP